MGHICNQWATVLSHMHAQVDDRPVDRPDTWSHGDMYWSSGSQQAARTAAGCVLQVL